MQTLKPGDKAIVRLDLSANWNDYQYCIANEMKQYNGKIVTITNAEDCLPISGHEYPASVRYRIKEDNGAFTWTDAMLFPNKSKVINTAKKSSINMKSIFKSILPQKTSILISIDRIICDQIHGKNVGISKENTLIEYPDEAVFDIPGFIIPTEIAKVKVGDIIRTDNGFAKILALNKNGFDILNVEGEKLSYIPSINKIFNKTYVPVVTTPFQNTSEINPMALMLMDKDVNSKNLLPFLFMQNQDKSFQMDNPMMLAALMSDDVDISTIFMMQMMNNQSK